MCLEGFGGKKDADEAASVVLKLGSLSGGVPVAHDQKVYFVGWFARLLNGQQWAGRGRGRSINELIFGTYVGRPDIMKGAAVFTFLHDDMDRRIGSRKAEGFGKC